MSREIKFRAWNARDRKMVDLADITPLALDDDMNAQLAAMGGSGLFIPFVKETEIMQFTGIRDVNGNEIYEGDIVRLTYIKDEGKGWRSNSKEQGVVYFDPHWGVKFDCKDLTQRTADGWKVKGGQFRDARDVKVIGNIHENPELLEAK